MLVLHGYLYWQLKYMNVSSLFIVRAHAIISNQNNSLIVRKLDVNIEKL